MDKERQPKYIAITTAIKFKENILKYQEVTKAVSE
jgi:hypothetical protein